MNLSTSYSVFLVFFLFIPTGNPRPSTKGWIDACAKDWQELSSLFTQIMVEVFLCMTVKVPGRGGLESPALNQREIWSCKPREERLVQEYRECNDSRMKSCVSWKYEVMRTFQGRSRK